MSFCPALEHEWSVEEVSGNGEDQEITFRCKRCHRTLTGKVNR